MKKKKNQRKTLLDVTRELLINRPRPLTLHQISEEIGVSESWLNRLVSGHVNDPGVNSIQRLYEYLAGKDLPY